QPILQKAAMYQPHLADCAFANQRASFLTQRVIAQVVRHSAHPSRFFRQGNQRRGFPRIQRQRLFAQDILPRAEKLAGLLEMLIVWRAQMHHLNGRIRGEFLERSVRSRQSQRIPRSFGALRRAPQHPLDRNTKAPQGVQVGSPDESQSDDGRVDFLHEDSLWTLWTDQSFRVIHPKELQRNNYLGRGFTDSRADERPREDPDGSVTRRRRMTARRWKCSE